MGGTTGSGKGLVLLNPSVEMLSDVSAPVANNGDVLTYQSSTGQWVAAPSAGGGISAIAGDVSAAGTGTVSAVVVAIQKTQVSAGTIVNNQVLTYNAGKGKWVPRAVAGSGTVTSVAVSGKTGITVSGSPITGAGVITVTLGNITPTSISTGAGAFSAVVSANAGISSTTGNFSGFLTGAAASFSGVVSANAGIKGTTGSFSSTLAASNLSGTNTGDQTITLSGDVSGSGTGSFSTIVTKIQGTQVSAGTPSTGEVLTVAADGKWSPRAVAGTGTVTSVSAGAGLTASPNPITGGGSIQMLTTGVSAGRYTNPTLDINVLGVITSAANGSGGSSTPTFIFGTGFDGNVTISSGTTTLTRDMYYNNLTISGTGSLAPSGFKIFVANTLDLTAAPAGAIVVNGQSGTAGGNGNLVSGGSAGVEGAGGGDFTSTLPQVATIAFGGNGAGSAGQGGFASDGQGGANATSFFMMNGGNAGAAGAGGNSLTNNGGVAKTIPVLNTDFVPIPQYSAEGFIFNYSPFASGPFMAGIGGASASGGAGDATHGGGGGGAGGGGGGWVFIAYATLSGSTGTNAIDVSGGTGGTGGTAGTLGTGGDGGGGAQSGRVTLINVTTNTATETTVANGSAGSAHSGTSGGTGGGGHAQQVSL